MNNNHEISNYKIIINIHLWYIKFYPLIDEANALSALRALQQEVDIFDKISFYCCYRLSFYFFFCQYMFLIHKLIFILPFNKQK